MMEFDYMFCIPSYKRADRQKTLDTLERIGIPKENILVSVQTKEDIEAYRKAGVEGRVRELIYAPGETVAENRNTILNHFGRGAKIVMMDDDVSAIKRLSINPKTGKRKLVDVVTATDFLKLCDRGFALAEIHGTVAWGLNQYSNMFYMSKGYSTDKYAESVVIGIINSDIRYDGGFELLEDADFSARVYKRYGAIITFDNYTAIHSRLTRGGCHDAWNSENKKDMYCKMIVNRHGDIYEADFSKKNSITRKKGRKRK